MRTECGHIAKSLTLCSGMMGVQDILGLYSNLTYAQKVEENYFKWKKDFKVSAPRHRELPDPVR